MVGFFCMVPPVGHQMYSFSNTPSETLIHSPNHYLKMKSSYCLHKTLLPIPPYNPSVHVIFHVAPMSSVGNTPLDPEPPISGGRQVFFPTTYPAFRSPYPHVSGGELSMKQPVYGTNKAKGTTESYIGSREGLYRILTW